MTSLRKTIKQVFRNIYGLSSNMVIGPADVIKDSYDLIIVDEAHRLKRRKNITNYKSFDDTNKKMGFDQTATELDWILGSSKHQILFYDEHQSVKPSDIPAHTFSSLVSKNYQLQKQMRVQGGEQYISFINHLFSKRPHLIENTEEYDLRFYEKLEPMVKKIKEKNTQHSLSRLVAGYAWEWKSKNDKNAYDIEIQGSKLRWNSVNQGWVNSPNAINEVGCIHTVQGYDLNYVGVIVGPELSYDHQKKEFVLHRNLYKDKNGHRGVADDEEIKRYIINIYKTLLTRGIRGTYIYVVDADLREYLAEHFTRRA